MMSRRGLLLCAILPVCCAWTGASNIKSPCNRRLTVIGTPRTTSWLLAPISAPTRLAPLMDRIDFGSEKELTGKEADDAMKADFDFDPVVVGGIFAAFLVFVIGALVVF